MVRIGIGVIGAGVVGQVRASAIPPNADLRAVADLVPGRAQRAVRGTRAIAVTDYKRLLARDDVEAVVISSPAPAHEEMVAEAFAAGKHVLCEKPLATTVAGCRAMVAAAAKANLHLATGFNHRYFPSLRLVRQILGEGRIGELDHLRVFAGHRGLTSFHADWMYQGALAGGGAMMDVGLHLTDLVRWLAGEVVEVVGTTTNRVWKVDGSEDNALAILRTESGVAASYQATWSEWRGFRFHLEAHGTMGLVRATISPMTNLVVTRTSAGPFGRAWHLYPTTNARELFLGWTAVAREAFRDELADFVRRIRGDTTDLGTGEDGLRAVEIANAVYTSSRKGTVVKVRP